MTFDATALTRLSRVTDLAVAPGGMWAAVVVQRLDAEETRYVSDLWRVRLPRLRINERILAPEVRVIGAAGERHGVMPTDEARELASESDLDLVEISPRSSPPVCRLMDYGKYKMGPRGETTEPTRLTRGPSKDFAPRFRADGALGFLSNRNPRDGAPQDGDDRRMQVWILPPNGGEAYALTDEPLGCVDFAWSADALVVLAEVLPDVPHAEQRARAADLAKHGPTALHYTEGPVRHWDAWLPATSLHAIVHDARGRTDLTPDARHQLRNLPNDPGLAVHGGTVALAWSELGADRVPDGWIQRIEIATGATRALGRATRTYYTAPKFSKDGRLAAERTVRRPSLGDLVRLCVFDDDTVTPIEWDTVPSLQGWTDDGALLATAPDTGRQLAYRVTTSGEITALTEDGCAEHLVARGAGIVGIRHRTLHPPEPFACEPGEPPRLLANLSGFPEAQGAAIAAWESRTTPGDGGTPVQWFLVTPHQEKPPLLLWIHGGPVSQFADGWHWRWNPLVAAAAGYAVAMPNPRGSTGRGQTFIDGVQGNTWGAACYRDLLAVTDEAESLLQTPAAAMGGSFGGYMANWIGTQTDRFRCLVSHAGLFHLPAFYGSTDYPGVMGIEFGEHPFAGDLASFRRYSPDLHALRWKTPVLFIHGEKDYRVPITEALIAFEAVRTAGAEAELLVFPDENHWISRPRNIRAWYQAWLDFVARYLR